MNCGYLGCYNVPREGCAFCSRSCGAKASRARQTPEKRRAIASTARRAQELRDIRLLLAHVRLLGQTEEQRILLAWRLGRRARKSEAFRQRRRDAA